MLQLGNYGDAGNILPSILKRFGKPNNIKCLPPWNILAFGVRDVQKTNVHQKPPLETILENIKVPPLYAPFLFDDVIAVSSREWKSPYRCIIIKFWYMSYKTNS